MPLEIYYGNSLSEVQEGGTYYYEFLTEEPGTSSQHACGETDTKRLLRDHFIVEKLIPGCDPVRSRYRFVQKQPRIELGTSVAKAALQLSTKYEVTNRFDEQKMNERWFEATRKAQNGVVETYSYFVTPSGDLYEMKPASGSVPELLAVLGAEVYESPERLFSDEQYKKAAFVESPEA